MTVKGARIGAGAHLDVVFPWHVSVGMRPQAVDGELVSLRRGGRIVGSAGTLPFLHLDGVKRWGRDGPGFEPHQSSRGDVGR